MQRERSWFQWIESNFETNLKKIDQFRKLDDIVQKTCVRALEIGKKQFEIHKITNGLQQFEQQLKMVKNIRTKGDLRPFYKTMLNQCVVLIVSYFASAVQEVFEHAVGISIENTDLAKLQKVELKLTIDEIKYLSGDLTGNLGELLVSRKNDINFQDMRSIARTFDTYLGHEPEKDNVANNIILAQACRHAIVHSGGKVNDRVLSQIKKATPRDVKPKLSLDEEIVFDDGEIDVLQQSMRNYLNSLIDGVVNKLVGIGDRATS